MNKNIEIISLLGGYGLLAAILGFAMLQAANLGIYNLMFA